MITQDEITAACTALEAQFPRDVVEDLYPAYSGEAPPREQRLAESYKVQFPPAIVLLMKKHYDSQNERLADRA
jgi:hypothetical protein